MNLVPPDSECLWMPARDVTAEDRAMHVGTIKAMADLMGEKRGACLSAPQVGLPLAMFVSKFAEFAVVINPSYTYGTSYTSKPEGSISKPGWSTFVRRPDETRARFIDGDGAEQEIHLVGIEARCFCHACDYIAGTPIFPRPMHKTVAA